MLVLTYRGEVAVAEHKEMVDAALARDADRAVSLLRVHIHNGLEHTLTAIGASGPISEAIGARHADGTA